MYFKPNMIDAIVDGRKTETRRIVKPGEVGMVAGAWSVNDIRVMYNAIAEVYTPGGRNIKWQVGRDYAVCPGRGKRGAWWQPEDKGVTFVVLHTDRDREYGWLPLRIRILDIRQESLQDITIADCEAEGVSPFTFARGIMSPTPPDPRWSYIALWNSINTRKGTRWQDNPLVWVLTFEVVR